MERDQFTTPVATLGLMHEAEHQWGGICGAQYTPQREESSIKLAKFRMSSPREINKTSRSHRFWQGPDMLGIWCDPSQMLKRIIPTIVIRRWQRTRPSI